MGGGRAKEKPNVAYVVYRGDWPEGVYSSRQAVVERYGWSLDTVTFMSSPSGHKRVNGSRGGVIVEKVEVEE